MEKKIHLLEGGRRKSFSGLFFYSFHSKERRNVYKCFNLVQRCLFQVVKEQKPFSNSGKHQNPMPTRCQCPQHGIRTPNVKGPCHSPGYSRRFNTFKDLYTQVRDVSQLWFAWTILWSVFQVQGDFFLQFIMQEQVRTQTSQKVPQIVS
jgi:hypothetical protein